MTAKQKHILKDAGSVLVMLAVIVVLNIMTFGCTMMIGVNDVDHLAPRGSYRSVDTSGESAEGLQEMQGGGAAEATIPVAP